MRRITHADGGEWGFTDAEAEAILRALGGFLWLGNNLHNSATETFKEMYGHAMVDARPVYTALDSLLEKKVRP